MRTFTISLTVLLLLGSVCNNAPATPAKPQGFSFAGLSNRLITPNGDGKNDMVVFTFDNPQFSEITGKIYDLKSGFVSAMSHDSNLDPNTTMVWDGKSAGRLVPGGIYIYVIEGEGKLHRGSVAVIR